MLFMRLHYNFNVTIKTREEPHESVNRVFSEIAFEHSRHLGLRDTHELTSSGLSEFTFIGNPINFRDDLGFQKMSVGIRQAKIGKDIAASHFHFGFAYHHFFSFLNR